jgi:hypothetical protein
MELSFEGADGREVVSGGMGEAMLHYKANSL